ncbi:ATP-binding protein [Streptomyces sp. NPDC008139]|uniref:ATP-binding protein n=1 Tax=Streptomyces sp. NPDC008139 TaxID=3364814 RepID=UPI0036E09D95
MTRMTDLMTEVEDVGTLHRLDDHRTEAVQLAKPPADEAGKDTQIAGAPGADQRVWRRAARKARIVATHDRTRNASRLAVRHSAYVTGGATTLTRRAWDSRSAARYERMIRTAEAAGNRDEAKEWEDRGRAFRAARHQRRMDLLTAPQRLAKATLVGSALAGGGLVSLGVLMAVADKDPAQILVPVMATIEAVRWAVVIAAVIWSVAVWLVPALLLVALWNTGRQRQTAPRWALPAKLRGEGDPITPSILVTALRDLGISSLRKSIQAMEDSGAGMLSPIKTAGCGVEVDMTLPSGSSTEEVMKRRRKLAENMGRHEHEVHLAVAPAARTVRAWIADSGALDEPIGPSPLVTDPDTSADYAKGRAPWGVDLRGDAALISLYQRHMLITGLSNQGKTASLRALALWLAHDPAVRFWIGDLKGMGDWRMFDGIAEVLIEGPTDDHVIDVTEMVEAGVEEMNRRLLAPAGTVFEPLVIVVDEAQVAYGSGAIGPDKRPYGGSKATSRYFRAVKAIHDQGRAVDVTTWEGTQDPTDQNLPVRSRAGNHIRAALVLGTESQAKMALGETPVDAGAAPHKLRQGLDKGTVVVAGDGVKLAPGQPAITIRTHYIDGDEAGTVADRIKARRGNTPAPAVESAPADHLTDIFTVLADEPRVQSQEVLHRLNALNPTVYGAWGFADLKAALEPYAAEPYKSNGVSTVGRDRVQEAVTERMRDAFNALDA